MVNSKIISLDTEDDFVNIAIYGPSGIGKTVLAGSDEGVLFVAPEDGGTLSAKRFGSKAQKWPVNSFTDIIEAYDYLWDLSESATKPLPYKWIVIDSATEMQEMTMRYILDEARKENPARDPDIPAIQDWQRYYEMFKRLVKGFNALPVNVLWTLLEQDATDEEGNLYKVPLLKGKGVQYAKQFSSWMTSFGYMQVVRVPSATQEADKPKSYDERRVITWRATPTVTAKDRTRCLEPYTVDLTLRQIRERIEAGPPEKAAPTSPQPKSVPVVKGENASEATDLEDANA